ncbi:RNA polymerase sigma factor [Psychrobacillus sp. NPDC096426]|uniref:RNA polymerase sigma factor n=1 Tax=Psychrobacillus sp. NPDC096426 TaxID=3364491 RepID=UPI00382B770B
MSEYNFDPFLTELKKYCYMLAGTPWNGEDLFQDTLIKLLTNSSSLSKHPNPKGYIFKTATNQWYDTIRKTKREIVGINNEDDLGTFDYSLLESVEILISLLPFKQAATLLLKEYFGFTSNDIAKMLDMTTGGVKAAINRAKKNLTKLENLQQTNEEPTPNLLNRMLNGLKRNDFKCVVSTYHLLVSRGIKIKKSDDHFIFELLDPDGNRFWVKEKI